MSDQLMDFRSVDFAVKSGDNPSARKPDFIVDEKFNADYFAARGDRHKVTGTDDFGTVTLYADPDDSQRDAYNEEAINRNVPDVYPHLTSNQEDFAAKAAGIVQEFASLFPNPPADKALTELFKQFSGEHPDGKVIDAINLKMEEWYKNNPNEARVRLGFSELTGDYYLGLLQSNQRYDPTFKLNGTDGDRLPPG